MRTSESGLIGLRLGELCVGCKLPGFHSRQHVPFAEYTFTLNRNIALSHLL